MTDDDGGQSLGGQSLQGHRTEQAGERLDHAATFIRLADKVIPGGPVYEENPHKNGPGEAVQKQEAEKAEREAQQVRDAITEEIAEHRARLKRELDAQRERERLEAQLEKHPGQEPLW